jgi:hypothetical protein
MGDPQFPNIARRRNKTKKLRLFHFIFEMYSRLALTVASDKSFAISGVERRLAKIFHTKVAYGILENHLHRSLMWRRSGDKMMERIKYPTNREVPSWSWMVYHGEISYLSIPPEKVEWNNSIQFTFTSRQQEGSDHCEQNGDDASHAELKVPVIGFSEDEMGKEEWRLILDDRDTADIRNLKCIIVGRRILKEGDNEQDHYILVVAQRFSRGVGIGYERVGVGSV